MKALVSIICRVFFVASFIFAGFAFWEKAANMMGYTVLRGEYTPWRLMEFAAVILLFVVALQLREIKTSLRSKGSA